MKIIRGWDPKDGPKPYSEEWWWRLDIKNALRAAVKSTKTRKPNEAEKLLEALRPPPEPPANCQDCERRHNQCAEFKALDHSPETPYNREYCHWYLKEIPKPTMKHIGPKEVHVFEP